MDERPRREPSRRRSETRRDLLKNASLGFGWLAAQALLPEFARAAPISPDPLAMKPPHFAPRAKRIIFLFMHGGPSHVDTFDYKPLLQRDDGKPVPPGKPGVLFGPGGNLLRSPYRFERYGESGTPVSEIFPHLAAMADDLCFIHSMHTPNAAHGGALLSLHTGSDTFVRPSMGSWILYGLGTENRDLPGFLTICPSLGHGGANNWSSAFLPSAYQGTPVGFPGTPMKNVSFRHLSNKHWSGEFQRRQVEFLADLNGEHLEQRQDDDVLDARLQSFELAFRMQKVAPKYFDLNDESDAVKKLYGIDEPTTDNFARQCLLARRFCESGVRFVQCTHAYKWDQHTALKHEHALNAREVDKPIAGLLQDLKSRGLWDDTLVIWGGEFGRTPSGGNRDGRDHNPHGFTIWLAGGGVKGGHHYGATDDYGCYASVDVVDMHDLHATLLHLLGVDHKKLTYRYAGRDFRLTDVAGNVVTDVLA